MGIAWKIILALTVVGAAYLWHAISKSPPIPKLERTWWGPGKPIKQDESIRPFTIKVADEILDDLSNRLKSHRNLTPPLEGKNFEYGFNTDYLSKIVDFWRRDYNWRDREVYLNRFPQFKTRISGLDLHYIHVKPTQVPAGTKVLPLLVLHGWPGSVREFYELIPLLTTQRKGTDFVFEVIAPSLPGFGFSEGASKSGLGPAEIAFVMDNLMERVGHNKYYVQGGDWGSIIVTSIAILYPEKIIGLHSNFCIVDTPISILKMLVGSISASFDAAKWNVYQMHPHVYELQNLLLESGYFHIQATKPDTVGVALTDSPIGLAAYLLEKFSSATNRDWRSLPDGGLTKKFTLTDLLDNVMIYWVTGSITTSVRIYAEAMSKAELKLGMSRIPCKVPSACAMFPNEITYFPQWVLKERYSNIVKFTDMPRGGHFAALEEPLLLANDVWEAVQIFENQKKHDKY